MAKQNASLVVNILTSADLRRYAENRLPREYCLEVEQALLDDDRARDVVLASAGAEKPAALTGLARHLLIACLNACKTCISGHRRISEADGASTERKFAASRLSQLDSLFSEMRDLLAADDAAEAFYNVNSRQNLAGRHTESGAAEGDSALLDALYALFDAVSAPANKACVAGWIAEIQAARDQIVWLRRS